MLSKKEILSKLNELKPTLSSEYAVKKIGLFGSFNDETNTADSDIDLIIDLEKPIGWKFFSLELYLEKVFGRDIDLVTKKALRKEMKKQILEKAKYAW
ncbi:nucleotidyltransferase domain-containing protein [Salibacter sp.]|uniref:nucleotidyltransferase family protein n=1 Tax=Salibacter sp. TaxID=2010995 RepID=UPI0028708325|nr:nucleotidyltransferase domain-containing protein [Salibacter sp.]MDR9398222.1 nucleotidyltransferase domain-containing protein [Salibacter sp.]MDR9487474.1 nucleotidyltransferase domain-containing protein [Salibacter sp.]